MAPTSYSKLPAWEFSVITIDRPKEGSSSAHALGREEGHYNSLRVIKYYRWFHRLQCFCLGEGETDYIGFTSVSISIKLYCRMIFAQWRQLCRDVFNFKNYIYIYIYIYIPVRSGTQIGLRIYRLHTHVHSKLWYIKNNDIYNIIYIYYIYIYIIYIHSIDDTFM